MTALGPGEAGWRLKRPFNHGLYFAVTLFTCGLWLPVWILLAIVD